jgi:hypothetical protein
MSYCIKCGRLLRQLPAASLEECSYDAGESMGRIYYFAKREHIVCECGQKLTRIQARPNVAPSDWVIDA